MQEQRINRKTHITRQVDMITKSPILFTKVLCFQYNIKFFENISGFKDIRTV